MPAQDVRDHRLVGGYLGPAIRQSTFMMKPTITVVVPVYNSEGSLRPLVERLEQVLATLASDFELILVNDSSQDRSGAVARELARDRPWIVYVELIRNFGQHNAVLCGIRKARFDYIVTMDDDLQHPPDEIRTLMRTLIREDADVVYGTPRKEQHGFFRDLASIITKLVLQKAMGAQIARQVSAFRLFRTEVRQAFEHYSGAYVSIDVLLTWGTTRFAATPVRHEPRRIGTSNYTMRKLVTHAVNMITGFSVWPLQMASIAGFAFTFFGGVLLTYVVGRYLLDSSRVPGFAFLASAIALFSGVQLFVLGVIGEYLARMHYRSMEKPTYVVRKSPEPSAAVPRNEHHLQASACVPPTPAFATRESS